MTFGTIDDRGTLYVNGQKAGSADDWSHPWTFDITQYLHVGDNSIALLVQNDWGPGGPYKGCDIEPIGRTLEGLQVSPATSVAGGAISRRYTAAIARPLHNAIPAPAALHQRYQARGSFTWTPTPTLL